jgi:hypothetical protein
LVALQPFSALVSTSLSGHYSPTCRTNTRLASASTQANTVSVYNDPETGFTFSQYQATYSLSGKSITVRVAVPSDAQPNTPYDAVVQIVAPSEVGWMGLAWGGSMTYNPLTVSWMNGNSPVISSRYAT